MRNCERCEKELATWRSSRARFCSARCRVANHRARRRIPADLTRRDCWVRRDLHKRPLTLSGHLASVSASDTWATYRDARKSTAGAGLGFVLDGSGIGVIDLDNCIHEGRVAPWAQQILDANPGTFTETSLSGRGLHIWGYLDRAPGRRIRDGRKIEIYSTGRYIALGTPRRGTPRRLKHLALPI